MSPGHISITSTLAHYTTGTSISHQYSCTLCQWPINQPPVLLHIMQSGALISPQYSCMLCHWAIYQPPVLLHIMPLGNLSITNLSVFSFLLLYEISGAIPSINRMTFYLSHTSIFLNFNNLLICTTTYLYSLTV